MKSFLRFYAAFVSSVAILVTTPAWSVIILESTYQKSGFKKAESLALEPQFASLIYLEGDESSGSGSWIGNYKGHGYVLTAGHLFTDGIKASYYTYQTIDGTEYQGEAVFFHPLWNGNLTTRTGYDFAIVRLKEKVTDGGAQPVLYGGNHEKGKMLTFIGYGWRGAGKKGQDTSIDTGDRPAAAKGLIESVEEAVEPVPKKGDAGNYIGIWLPKEDGSLSNPFTEEGITKPVSALSGILGSGDSGGPAWIRTENGWAIVGINSNGSGNAAYGDKSWFPRISHVRGWIEQIVPNTLFTK
ncbi:V8-like Glu-specific endopeptidase [Legionella donaldsonii]|uniref:V8-like Glu-specific endopeptidase n=1 Tax=Legionella donaldsonii TaxID=45060 RepID=A0A378J9F5_9GAMM|nr:trypsin-like serine protease [Legionella donaldsonii]STX44443.1 V8-like Glu-specific endopeptidase [Legionella donaldsonii]